VFDDADIDAAVEGAMVAKMRHSAETCTAANRFFVHAAVAGEFTRKLSAAMGAIRIGNGMDDGVTCGPMINATAIDTIDELVAGAVDGGAKVAVGGKRGAGTGYFYEPTVLGDVAPDAKITGHEIFGPVAPIISFDDTDSMVDQANNTEMGLTAYVYTQDLGRGLSVSERIQAGMVGLNRGAVSDPAAPFGGMKQSGLGRAGASEGNYEFCETQYIATTWCVVAWGQAPRNNRSFAPGSGELLRGA
jgi:succinate-semialdehyde dehydrogenase/glutarate-semialdehyde dehydrogenase